MIWDYLSCSFSSSVKMETTCFLTSTGRIKWDCVCKVFITVPTDGTSDALPPCRSQRPKGAGGGRDKSHQLPGAAASVQVDLQCWSAWALPNHSQEGAQPQMQFNNYLNVSSKNTGHTQVHLFNDADTCLSLGHQVVWLLEKNISCFWELLKSPYPVQIFRITGKVAMIHGVYSSI